jgi:hypothetical protein
MSMITIDNLSESRELDSTAGAELRGGVNLPALPAIAHTVQARIDETHISLAELAFTNYADNGSIAQTGPVNITNVIGSSSLTLLQGAV